ncbi:MAG: hypothetical protein WKF84_21380 [Pyrinomonadaceae bacterium]
MLFDMVIHGFDQKSPITKQSAFELFVRTETGALAGYIRRGRASPQDWAAGGLTAST